MTTLNPIRCLCLCSPFYLQQAFSSTLPMGSHVSSFSISFLHLSVLCVNILPAYMCVHCIRTWSP